MTIRASLVLMCEFKANRYQDDSHAIPSKPICPNDTGICEYEANWGRERVLPAARPRRTRQKRAGFCEYEANRDRAKRPADYVHSKPIRLRNLSQPPPVRCGPGRHAPILRIRSQSLSAHMAAETIHRRQFQAPAHFTNTKPIRNGSVGKSQPSRYEPAESERHFANTKPIAPGAASPKQPRPPICEHEPN